MLARREGAGGLLPAVVVYGLAITVMAVPAHGFWVMLTYVVGQALLAAGVVGVGVGRSR